MLHLVGFLSIHTVLKKVALISGHRLAINNETTYDILFYVNGRGN